MAASRGSGVLSVTFLVIIMVVTTHASNFSTIFNPIGLLQQAGETVMAKLMRSTPPGQPNPEPRPLPATKASSEMADRVASLVTNGLGETMKKQQGKPKPQQKQQQSGGGGLFGGFMRLLGLDSTRLGAIAINAFVYVSELIAATLTRMNPPGPAGTRSDFNKPPGTPFSWLLDNPGPKIAEALRLAQDRELPEILITLLRGRSKRSLFDNNEGPTWCLQRLMCQLSPVLWGMQKAVAETISPASAFQEDIPSTPTAVIWKHLPSRDELRQRGNQCETRFPECELPQPGDMI